MWAVGRISLLSWGRPPVAPAEALAPAVEAKVAAVAAAPSSLATVDAARTESPDAASPRGLAAAALRMSSEPATLVIAVPETDPPEEEAAPELASIIEVAASGQTEVADQGWTAGVAEPTRSELPDPIPDTVLVETEPNAGDAVPDSAAFEESIAAATETGIEESVVGSTTAHGVEEPAPEAAPAVTPLVAPAAVESVAMDDKAGQAAASLPVAAEPGAAPVLPAATRIVAESAVPAEAPGTSVTASAPVAPAVLIEAPRPAAPAPGVTPTAPPRLSFFQRLLRAIRNFFRAIFGL